MATIRFSKVVSALPGTLTPDTLYMVRTGVGFDLFCSNSTGSIAHALNIDTPTFTYGPTAPTNPQPGDVWFQTT